MINSQPRPYTFDRVMRIIFAAIAIVGTFFVLNLLKDALLPFLVAWLIAYLLNPMVQFFQNKLRIKNRLLAIIATLLTVFVVLSSVAALLVPTVVAEVEKTSQVLQELSLSAHKAPVVEKAWYQAFIDRIDFNEISKMLNPDEWTKLIEGTLTQVWTLLSGSVAQIMNIVGWFIVFLYLVFILLDYERIIVGFRQLIPAKYREVTLSIFKDVEDGMNKYFRGQSFIALCVGVLFSVGFVIIGLPLAIPLGLFIGVLNLVPYLQIVGLIPTILLCLLGSYNGESSFWTLFWLSMAVFAAVQTIQDMYITPKVMGKVTGLNPAIILLSLSIWGSLMGVMGMIIALPLTTLLLSYYQKYILERNDLKGLSDDRSSEDE